MLVAVAVCAQAVALQPLPEKHEFHGVRAFDLIRKPKFRQGWVRLLPGSSQGWLRNLDGPSTRSFLLRLGDDEWLVVQACKPHGCAWNRATIFLSLKEEEKITAYIESDDDEDGPRTMKGRWLGPDSEKLNAVIEQVLRQLGSL